MHFLWRAFASIMMIVDWKVRADKIPPPQLLHGCIFKLPSQHWLCFLSGWHCTAMKNICSADFFPYFYFPFLCILYKKLNLPILKSIQFQFQEMILVHGWRLGQSLNKYNYWYLDRQAIAMLKYSSFIRRNKYKYHNRLDDTNNDFLSRKKFYQGHHSTENTPYI